MDGNFTIWENVGNCSQSCGGGRQYQRRNCTNPAPAYGGNNCTGNTSRTISCNSHACSGIQTKEFLLLLCTEILQFASKLSTLCLVSFICFGLLCKRICFSFMTYLHPFFDKFDYIDGEMLVSSLNTFAVLPWLNFLLAIKKKTFRSQLWRFKMSFTFLPVNEYMA